METLREKPNCGKFPIGKPKGCNIGFCENCDFQSRETIGVLTDAELRNIVPKGFHYILEYKEELNSILKAQQDTDVILFREAIEKLKPKQIDPHNYNNTEDVELGIQIEFDDIKRQLFEILEGK